jgi:hypothetical protein
MSPFLVKTIVQSSKRKAKSISSPKKDCMHAKQTGAISPLPRNSKKARAAKRAAFSSSPFQTLCKSLSKSPSFPPQDPSSQISLLSFWDQ